MGNTVVPVLSYDVGPCGWSQELTRLHEEAAGKSHCIDRASREHAIGQLAKYLRDPCSVVLDVGCSSGFTLRAIRARYPAFLLIGSDPVRGPLEQIARDMPDVPLLQFDLVSCPLPDSSIDAVLLLNVLEHIPNDSAALDQVYRILRPGGIAIIEVPAGPHLYDVYDRLLLHHRRYALGGLAHLVEQGGFRTLERSHLGFFIYPGFWIAKRRGKRFLSADATVQRRIVAQSISKTRESRALDVILRFELALGRRVSFPFGIRCLLTCRKMTRRELPALATSPRGAPHEL
jgi:SAM-dependent methyltransferase